MKAADQLDLRTRFPDRQEQLSRKGDPLERLGEVIDWDDFRPLLKKARPKPGPQGGRTPYDGVLLFKMLALASLYGLSDEQLEYQVKDRLSFMRFLGLDLQDRVPDATTIWLFREELGKKRGLLDKLFQRFKRHLRKASYEARGGQILDPTLWRFRRFVGSRTTTTSRGAGSRTGMPDGRRNTAGPTSDTRATSVLTGDTS